MASRACCTTPGALCFWGCIFAITYGAVLIAAGLWAPLSPFDQTLVLDALGVACVVNAAVNRTFHCLITGPLFTLAAVAVGLTEAGVWNVGVSLVWTVALIGFGIALWLEWRTTRLIRAYRSDAVISHRVSRRSRSSMLRCISWM